MVASWISISAVVEYSGPRKYLGQLQINWTNRNGCSVRIGMYIEEMVIDENISAISSRISREMVLSSFPIQKRKENGRIVSYLKQEENEL